MRKACTNRDNVDAAVMMDPSGLSKGKERVESPGNSMDHANSANAAESTKGEDAAVQTVSLTFADRVDSMRDDAESADHLCSEDSKDSADLLYHRSGELENTSDDKDQSAEGGSNNCESDSDNTSEETCLEAMTPDGQDYYLRLGYTPRRRSALRLSRIIARQQLLRKLAQGSQRGR